MVQRASLTAYDHSHRSSHCEGESQVELVPGSEGNAGEDTASVFEPMSEVWQGIEEEC